MSEIVFVRIFNDNGNTYEFDPLHPGGSASYTDYWRLVRLSGFKMCGLADIDYDSDNVYICAPNNGYTASFQTPRKCRIVHWELERPGTQHFAQYDEMWVSDRTQWHMTASAACKYVPLGGHKELGVDPRYPKMWDFCPLAYLYGARAEKVDKLAGLGFTIAPSTFDPGERNIILAHSRWGLMLHQTPHPIMTPLRAVLYACSRLPIVAEYVADTWPYQFIPYEENMATLQAMDNGYVQDMVDNNYYMMTETLTFRKCVEEAVQTPAIEG